MFDDVITLIHELEDEKTEEREVFATVESAAQSEFFAAAQEGMKAEYKASVWQSDYDGETCAKIDGRLYDVYRTFRRRDGKIELHLKEKAGV